MHIPERPICLLMILFTWAVVTAAASENTGRARLTQIVGKVEVRSQGAATWRSAKIGMMVGEQHTVRSFIESEAEVTFANGTVVKITENSIVSFSRMQFDSISGSSRSTVKMSTGSLWANVKKITDGISEFEFQTPTAVASIRGTRLGIRVDKQQTLLDVYEGLVAVRKKNGRKITSIPANTRAIINRDTTDIAVVTLSVNDASKTKNGNQSTRMLFDRYGNKISAADGPVTPDSIAFAAVSGDSTRNTQPLQAYIDTTGHPLSGDSIASRSGKSLFLTIKSPDEGAIISEPFILVSGITLPEAKIFVNEQQGQVDRQGGFMMQLPIPDEPYRYHVEIRAELGGADLVRQRSVVYSPRREKLFLECTSPAEGMVITGKSIHVSGKTSPGATVTANGSPVGVGSSGVFTREIPVTEKDIGEYVLEVTARNQDDEQVKTVNCEISGTSPLINTSVPILVFPFQGRHALIQNFMTVQVLDHTPQDELTITVIRNGMTDVMTSNHGKTEKILLDEGKNDYLVTVSDRADNKAPTVKGTIYYLPGPLKLTLIEPSSGYTMYDGLPPAMHPGQMENAEPIDVEIEIDDGIGTVPETIKYCKVTGNAATVLLRNNNDYRYTGKVNVRRGTNQFIVQVEDISARLETTKFTIVVK